MGADSSSTGPEPSPAQDPRGGSSAGVGASASPPAPPASSGSGKGVANKPTTVLYPILAIRQPNSANARLRRTTTSSSEGTVTPATTAGESERGQPLARGGADGGSSAVQGGGGEAVAAGAGSAPLKARNVSCRSCVGLSLMTSKMRLAGQPAACYGVRRSVDLPQLPEVRDDYIDEVLRSRAKWTYVCVGASESIEDPPATAAAAAATAAASAGGGGAQDKGTAVAGTASSSTSSSSSSSTTKKPPPPSALPPLPTCRGLLIFMDGEEEEDPAVRRRREQQRQQGQGQPAPERPTHIVGGIMNRRATQQPRQQQQQPGAGDAAGANTNGDAPARPGPSFPSDGTPIGDAMRRVGDFWSNATDDFANKYMRSSKKLLSAMDRQARQLVVTGQRMLGAKRGGGEEDGEDESSSGSGGPGTGTGTGTGGPAKGGPPRGPPPSSGR